MPLLTGKALQALRILADTLWPVDEFTVLEESRRRTGKAGTARWGGSL